MDAPDQFAESPSGGKASRSTSHQEKKSFPGSCYCHEVEYVVDLNDPEKEARTSICYCQNCRKWTGSAFGITTRIPKSAFRITRGETKKHVSDNGSGTKLHREFCGTCGSGILEYGENAGDKTYVTYGSFERPTEIPPRGEFFCKYRDEWMPEIPGSFSAVVCKCWHPQTSSAQYDITV